MLFLDRVESALNIARRREDYQFAMLAVDIDGFNAINNTYGYAAGDRFLHLFARRIEECLRPEDLLAHLGADEFGILLENIDGAGHAIRVAESIQSRLEECFVMMEEEIFCSAGIGIAMGSPSYLNNDGIVRDAEIALKRAASKGKSQIELYDETMLSIVTERFQVERNLRKALERNEFMLYYQPIVSLRSGLIESFECLLRWDQPGKGMTPPAEFIHVSEESGLIIPIGEWVLYTACRHTKQCRDSGHGNLKVAVNLSAHQFQKENLHETVERILNSTGLDPCALKLEITESTAARDPESAVVILSRLKSLGITLLIDDFGTGYSNLSYLKRFPIDTLKIDRSFVIDIPHDQDSVSIAKTIIAMARNLNLEVLAEGIETDEQLTFFRDEGCDYVQGFLISMPVAAENCEDLLLRKVLI